jgi:putative pre-16S rRNA nuclease
LTLFPGDVYTDFVILIMRLMGLDVGDKRIGVALSDEGAVLATPRETMVRQSNKKDITRLVDLAHAEQVGEILVGMPYFLDGSSGPQAEKVSRFVDALRAGTEIPVTIWDERLTTVAAEEILAENGVPRAERRAAVDRVAAAVILQSYLDSKRSSIVKPTGPDECERVVDS